MTLNAGIICTTERDATEEFQQEDAIWIQQNGTRNEHVHAGPHGEGGLLPVALRRRDREEIRTCWGLCKKKQVLRFTYC